MWWTIPPFQGCQIEIFSLIPIFHSIFDPDVAEIFKFDFHLVGIWLKRRFILSFRFWLDIDLSEKTIWLDTKRPQQVLFSKLAGQFLKGLSSKMAGIFDKFRWWFCSVNLSISTVTVQDFFLPECNFLFIWNRIENIQLFDFNQNIECNNEIHFDFDSIWQPCLLEMFAADAKAVSLDCENIALFAFLIFAFSSRCLFI